MFILYCHAQRHHLSMDPMWNPEYSIEIHHCLYHWRIQGQSARYPRPPSLFNIFFMQFWGKLAKIKAFHSSRPLLWKVLDPSLWPWRPKLHNPTTGWACASFLSWSSYAFLIQNDKVYDRQTSRLRPGNDRGCFGTGCLHRTDGGGLPGDVSGWGWSLWKWLQHCGCDAVHAHGGVRWSFITRSMQVTMSP